MSAWRNAATCCDCKDPIPSGLAVIRSRSFVQVAMCRPCAGMAPIESESVVAPLAS